MIFSPCMMNDSTTSSRPAKFLSEEHPPDPHCAHVTSIHFLLGGTPSFTSRVSFESDARGLASTVQISQSESLSPFGRAEPLCQWAIALSIASCYSGISQYPS